MTDAGDLTTLEELSRDECYTLVRSASIGRLAVSYEGGAPLVVPVNYVLDDEDIVFRTGPGAKLRALRESPVSFQVDQIDPVHRTGWSVLVRGIARIATDEEIRHLVIEHWAPGDNHHWIRVLPTEITGRAIRLPEVAWETRGYL
jgi:nitroimidazol reductase NimA-like FMN-containing flavoprotein (pyridoxamine 5'-phosphate oxidase superfamily)